MRSIAIAASLILATACAQAPSWTEDEKPIYAKLRTLRSLPDAERGGVTRELALAIRKLTSPGQLRLASGLTGLSTEGDFGKGTLQEVATTLAQAIERNPPPPDQSGPYEALAQLIRYEHVEVAFEDPRLKAAFAKLDAADQKRQNVDFTLKDLEGKSWTLKELKGSVVLINFWATWCPPCRKEMPDLDALYRRFQSKGLVILAISDEPEGKVRPFLADKHYSYPMLLDPGRKVNDLFSIEGIPRSFLYNRDGKLAAEAIDMRTEHQFLELLKQAGLQE
jgi:peroxiredoxin